MHGLRVRVNEQLCYNKVDIRIREKSKINIGYFTYPYPHPHRCIHIIQQDTNTLLTSLVNRVHFSTCFGIFLLHCVSFYHNNLGKADFSSSLGQFYIGLQPLSAFKWINNKKMIGPPHSRMMFDPLNCVSIAETHLNPLNSVQNCQRLASSFSNAHLAP